MNNPNYAVKFGQSVDRGLGPSKAYPFFYNFVPRRDDTWTAGNTTPANANVGIGPTVNAGTTVSHVIQLDPDFNFKLLWFKYTAYYYDSVNLNWEWYNDEAGFSLNVFDMSQGQWVGTPLYHFLRVTVTVQPNARYLYGGLYTAPNYNGEIPLDVELLQGYDYGYGQVRTPMLLPKEGQIVFKITNNHATKNMIVGGAAFGLKVRI